MKRWYPKVYSADKANDADLNVALDAIDAYTEEYERARQDLSVSGSLEKLATRVPGMIEHRSSQLYDLEAIIEYFEQRERIVLVNKTKFYLEHYQRTLTERLAKDYADTSDEVQLIREVRTRVGNIRDLWVGITKGIEYLHYQSTNVTKLRCAGLEDVEIGHYRD